MEWWVDIKFLDKFTPSTQELAHFEDGKFDFCSYPSQLKFITLFKKYPRLKRELLKVSYPIGRRMRFDIDMERFKRSTKYNWIKFKRNFMLRHGFIHCDCLNQSDCVKPNIYAPKLRL